MNPETNDEGMPVYQALATVAAEGGLKLVVFLDDTGELAAAATIKGAESHQIVKRMLEFQKPGSA